MAGLALLVVAAAATVIILRPASVTAYRVTVGRPRVAGPSAGVGAEPTSGPDPSPSAASAAPIATLVAPDAIVEYQKPADQAPAATLRKSYPIPGVEHPFGVYYRDAAGHTATIWGGTGMTFTKQFDVDAVDALLTGLGPLGGVAADHSGLAMSGLASTARCSQFTTQSQSGTSCVWVGYGAVLAFVFAGLDAPGASDIIWVMLDKIVLY